MMQVKDSRETLATLTAPAPSAAVLEEYDKLHSPEQFWATVYQCPSVPPHKGRGEFLAPKFHEATKKKTKKKHTTWSSH